MKKRGLSAVVTTLIIILLVLVAVGVVWVVIANLITEGAEQVSLGKFTINMEIKNVEVDSSAGTVEVKVKRNPGKGELSGIKFLVSDGVEVHEFEEETTMGELGQRTFNLPYNGLVKELSIAPILESESGKEFVGNEIDMEELTYESCYDILNNGGSTDGVYEIKAGGESFEVYCDMTTDGGGWTLVWKSDINPAINKGEVNSETLTDPTTDTFAKFSDNRINQIKTIKSSSEVGFWVEEVVCNRDSYFAGDAVFDWRAGGIPRGTPESRGKTSYAGAWYDDSYTSWCQGSGWDSSIFCFHTGGVSGTFHNHLSYPDSCAHCFKSTSYG